MADSSIVFLIQVPFSDRDYKRNGIAFLAAEGIRVTVLDVSKLAMPRLTVRPQRLDFPGMTLRIVDTPAKLAAEAPTLAGAGVIVCHVGSGYVMPDTLGVLRAVARSGRPTLLTSVNAQPLWRKPPALEALRPSGLRRRLGAANPLASLLNRIPLPLLGIRPFDYVVYGGKGSRASRRLVTAQTRVITAHTMDYDIFLAERDTQRPDPASPTALFIDQYVGYHPDAAMGIDHSEDPVTFYPRLRTLFDRIECELGLRVVVAAHPRADYSDKPGLFGERAIVSGDTAALVRQSQLVVSHYSTALNFAVLFDKPAVMVTTARMLAHPIVGDSIIQLNQALAVPLLRIDLEYSLDGLLSQPRAGYATYREDWIKAPGSPERPMWRIIVDALRADRVL